MKPTKLEIAEGTIYACGRGRRMGVRAQPRPARREYAQRGEGLPLLLALAARGLVGLSLRLAP